MLNDSLGGGRAKGVRDWERRARTQEHAIEIFDLSPQTILLPRALCVLRFKSTEFHRRTTISDWDFSQSLRAIGYAPHHIRILNQWLSTTSNRQRIEQWDVVTFAQVLKNCWLNQRG